MTLLRLILSPFYPILYLIIVIRHLIYDKFNTLSYKSKVRTISIGNLKAGGTGKSPFTDLLINKFKKNHNLALLSRGYGRVSKGYVLATPETNSFEIGDEPKMLQLNNLDITVAVCEKRAVGINKLTKHNPSIDLILLDDAMQHRAVTPSVSIMLTEYDKPYFNDYLFPIGMLRDIRSRAKSADIIIVTKSPNQLTIGKMDEFVNKVKKIDSNKVYFSAINSLPPKPIFDDNNKVLEKNTNVVILTGIASADKFIETISKEYNIVKENRFKDHYNFKQKDIDSVVRFAKQNDARIIMTAKDKVKIMEIDTLTDEQKEIMYCQDISYKILEYRGKNLNSLIKEIESIGL